MADNLNKLLYLAGFILCGKNSRNLVLSFEKLLPRLTKNSISEESPGFWQTFLASNCLDIFTFTLIYVALTLILSNLSFIGVLTCKHFLWHRWKRQNFDLEMYVREFNLEVNGKKHLFFFVFTSRFYFTSIQHCNKSS